MPTSLRRRLSAATLGFIAVTACIGAVPTAAQTAPATAPSATTTPADLQPLGIGLEGFDYPFPVRHHHLDVQGRPATMAYMDVPPAPGEANGQAVLLLHGKNFPGAYWGRTARDLAARGYRVVVPDQIGFGKSSKLDDIQYSFHELAQNTAGLLDALGVQRVHVLGHSMGGMLAARFALMYPKRTASLILLNPIGLEDWNRIVPYRSVDESYRRELEASYESIRQYQLTSYYGGQWRPEYEPWVRVLAGVKLSPEYPRLARVQALTSDMIFTQPVVYELDRIRAPTLMIIGQRDRTALNKDLVDERTRATLGNYPELGRRAARQIPNAELVELEGVGHLPQLEAYERFFEPLARFLQSHSRAEDQGAAGGGHAGG